jgi:hypothetical protein
VLGGLLGCDQGVLIAAEPVVEQRACPLDDGQPDSLAPCHRVLDVGLDQGYGVGFAAAVGGEQYGTIGRELRPNRLRNRRRLLEQRGGRREVAREEVSHGGRLECDRQHGERAGLAGHFNVAVGEHGPSLVPGLEGGMAGEPEPTGLLLPRDLLTQEPAQRPLQDRSGRGVPLHDHQRPAIQ